MKAMFLRPFCIGLLALCAGLNSARAQQPSQSETPKTESQKTEKAPRKNGELPPNEAPPWSDDSETAAAPPAVVPENDDSTSSSSRASIIDLSPPRDDLKEHPDSAAAMRRAEEEQAKEDQAADVQEFHSWNPMKALKDIEIGDYYFKRKNYRAALDRYKEALVYKENDAVATFRLAVCQEEMGDRTSALVNYTAYLKILPHGPFADDAQESVERLKAETSKTSAAAKDAAPSKP
jgi:tetratricopeptide (TPR) repeat protein